MVARTARVAM